MTAGDVTEGRFIVTPSGKLNRAAASCLHQELELLIRRGAAELVVDFADVELVDTTCLSVLLACRKMARESGGDLLITRPNDQVTAVLGMSNLDHILKRCDTPD